MNDNVYSSCMDFRLSDDQLEFQRHCHAFARDVMRPAAARHDRDQTVPYEVIREARAWGLHGMPYLERVGADETGLMNAIYAEELHWGCAGIALAISASSLCAAGIASSGTPEQIGRWIPDVVGSRGNPRIGAYAVTEPSAGSDVKSLRTTAKRDDDGDVRDAAIGDEGLRAVQDPVVAVALCGRAQGLDVGPGRRLGHGVGADARVAP